MHKKRPLRTRCNQRYDDWEGQETPETCGFKHSGTFSTASLGQLWVASVKIRKLEPHEISLHRDLRLCALRDSPDSFAETAADAEARDVEVVEKPLFLRRSRAHEIALTQSQVA